MPEPTDFNDPFSHFDPEVPLPLSAPDIRRRGDRLRRRNSGLAIAGGVAAIVLIAAPLALLTRGDDPGAIPPADRRTETVTEPPSPAPQPVSLVTQIPDDFPLAAGFPDTNEDGTRVRTDTTAQTADFDLCLDEGFVPDAAGPSDVASVVYSGGEDYRERMLSVWDDLEGARAGLATVREQLSGCTDANTVYTEESSPGSSDAAAFSVQFAGPDGKPASGPIISLGIIEAVRVENAVYLARYEGETGGGPDAAAAGVEQAAARSSEVVAAAYDVFGGAAAPAAPSATETSQAPGGSEDLSSFPLAMDWPDPTGVEPGQPGLQGPSSELKGFDYRVCNELLVLPGTTGDLKAGYTNVDDTRTRELLSFADAGGAVDFMAKAQAFYAACPRQPVGVDGAVRRLDVRETGLAGESFAVVDSTTIDGDPVLPLGVDQFIRLGRAVLIDTTYGEGSRADAPAVIDAMSLATANVVAEMCAFTDAGC